MRIRHILALGLVVNCGLISGVVWQSSLEQGKKAINTKPVHEVVDAPPDEFMVPVPPGMDTVVVHRAFLWRDVESDDYLELVGNLRSAGCPESTIRDIVLSRAADDYARRRWELLKPLQARFWDQLAKGRTLTDWEIPDAMEDQAEQLNRERRKMLDALEKELGVKAVPAVFAEAEYWSFLPPETLEQVRKVTEHFEQLSGQLAGSDRAKAEELESKRDEALRLLVGDDHWREYRLRRGAGARWLRGTSGLTLSEAEMRALSSSWETNGIDPRRLNLNERREALAAVAGAERVAEYSRRSDSDFEMLQKIARRHGLAADVAERAIRVKEVAKREAAAIAERAFPDEDARARAAAALMAGVKAELGGIYGEQAWPGLQKYGLDWVDRLFEGE
ncbi:MAG: hypothetical protein ISQ14_04380 [Verrucomicrobiae bacterium]|nr:hypothetical protein [Verrucomicrobiae bacterium]